MTTTTHRIPVTQHLWDEFRRAGADHLLAKLAYTRMCIVYGADSTDDAAVNAGRAAELNIMFDAMGVACKREVAVLDALANAQAAHIMGS